MTSDRSPTQRRPRSPLAQSSNMDSLVVPSSSRHRITRQAWPAVPLKMPSLPRFHPANFPSQHTSTASTPSSGVNSLQTPVSPRSQQRQYSDAQKQLYAYQREIIASATRSKLPSGSKPISPRLMPLADSPGPVTPLELEGDSYLIAGAASPGHNEVGQREYVERIIREETVRQRGDISPRRPTSIGSC